jgi:hypothetical protein
MSNDLPPVPESIPQEPPAAPKVSRFRGTVHSHWRPIGGWVCIISCGYELFILPVLGTILNIVLTQKVELVHVDKVLLIELIGVFVTYRTFEKYHEVDTK